MIKKLFSAKIHDKHSEPNEPGNKRFSFMLNKNGIGKSIIVKGNDKKSAEKKLQLIYPDHEVQFLWEWN